MDLTDAPRTNATIQGLVFQVGQPFSEGHECNVKEARVLNQTWLENLRNNFANKVKAKVAEYQKEVGEDQKVASTDLPGETLKELIQQFEGFQEAYEFDTRTGGKEADPVLRQAKELAKNAVRAKLKEKGYKLSSVEPEKMTAFIEKAIETNPRFLEEAEKIVTARNSAAADLEVDLT